MWKLPLTRYVFVTGRFLLNEGNSMNILKRILKPSYLRKIKVVKSRVSVNEIFDPILIVLNYLVASFCSYTTKFFDI